MLSDLSERLVHCEGLSKVEKSQGSASKKHNSLFSTVCLSEENLHRRTFLVDLLKDTLPRV